MITFDLTFETNQSIFTPNQTQQGAMRLAASNWGQVFDHNVTIDLLIKSVDDPNSDTLMSAGSNLTTDLTAGFEGNEVIRTKVLTGVDTNGSNFDGEVEINWGINWELDIDQTPDISVPDQEEYDFYSTFYHEISHALGFLGSIAKDGTDVDGKGINTPGSWYFFDQFVSDDEGIPLIDASSFLIDASKYIPLAEGGNSADGMSGLFFNGPQAVAANGNQPVGLFTPGEFSEGSSGSHLDDENPSFEGFLMLSGTDFGPGSRTLHPIEKAIFEDLGYQLIGSTPTSMLDLSDDAIRLNITSLGNNNTIRLQIDQVGVTNVSEIRIFDTDAAGANPTLVANFSILEANQLTASYAPTIILDDDDIEQGQSLIFEIIESGQSRFATLSRIDANEAFLDFGQGTIFRVDTANDEAITNLLTDDADGIDLSEQTGIVTVEMDVFREASFNNTVGFYRTNASDCFILIVLLT